MKVLVLNNDMTPLALWSWKHAMSRWLGADAVIPIESSNKKIISGGGKEWFVPSIVMVKRYQNKERKAAFHRRRVLIRDKHTCQYCGGKFHPRQLNIDHIIPRSYWKKNKLPGRVSSFTNTVAACISCNSRKADKTLEQAKMKLIKKPIEPTYMQCLLAELSISTIDKSWWPYLEGLVHVSTEKTEKTCV